MNSDSLIQSVRDSFAVLKKRKIDYILVGGIAILWLGHYRRLARDYEHTTLNLLT